MKYLCTIVALFLLIFPRVSGETSIIDRNPFVWPNFDSSTTNKAESSSLENPGIYEFHAVYELSGQVKVLLKDNKNNKFHWLVVGEDFHLI